MISRREFLKFIVGMGAYTALPFNLAHASEVKIDEAWSALTRDPITFDVEDRTIYAPWATYPEAYGDIYDVPSKFRTRSALMREIDDHYELLSHFQSAFEEAAQDEDSLAFRLYEKNESVAFDRWLREEPLKDLTLVVQNWLAMDLPWGFEYPLDSGPMGEAYGFFLRENFGVLKSLGVVIVEGEHPGSSYFAAELRIPIEDANYAAAALDIPIRFREGA